MSVAEIIFLSIGLAMDAFAVSIGKGLSVQKATLKQALCVGLWFGGFQALMPLLGYLLGSTFSAYISNIDHWIAFILLAIIGGNMIREAITEEEDEEQSASFAPKEMLLLAIATSIDALAAGVSLACLQVNIFVAIASIGIITCVISAIGLKVGNFFGARFKKKAEIFGGIVLIFIGLKTLLQHLLG